MFIRFIHRRSLKKKKKIASRKMSADLFCCLCRSPDIKEYKYLQNDAGECNETYKITVQYFNPKLLTDHIYKECSKTSIILCQNCWVHIQDFHDFQQTVIKCRITLGEISIKESLQLKTQDQDTAFFSGSYNDMYTEAKASLDEINIQKSTLDIKVEKDQVTAASHGDYSDIEMEEVQYILVMDNDCDDSGSETGTSKSPLHIGVEEFQYSTVCNNNPANETNTSLEITSIQKSSLHMKVKENHVMNSGDSDTDNGTRTKFVPINIKKSTLNDEQDEEFQVNSAYNVEYNNFSNKTSTTLEQITPPKSPLHIKEEEFQYSSCCNNYSVNKTNTFLEHTSIQNSPLHVKVEEEEYDASAFNCNESDADNVATTPINTPFHAEADEFQVNTAFNAEYNNFCNDGRTSLDQICLQKSPLNIKVEDQENDFFNDVKYSDTEGHQNSLEHQTDIEENFEMFNNIDEHDERPLHKSKTSSKGSKHLFSSDDDDCSGEDNFKREIIVNKYLADWQPQVVCEICGEACNNKIVKVNFKRQENGKSYDKCFDRHYYICGKLNSCKQTRTYAEFKCNICLRSFKRKIMLERHLVTHSTGNKYFQCQKCDKAYFAEFQLRYHIKMVHTPNNKCIRCGKTFKSILELKRHKELYHYICGVCGKCIASQKRLEQHKKVFHKKEQRWNTNSVEN